MAYKITFDASRIASLEWTDKEKQLSEWKKGKIFDEIVIKATGRNVRSVPFRKHATYVLFDYGIYLDTRTHPLEVTVICDEKGKATDIAIPKMRTRKYPTRTDPHEIHSAILLADTTYAKIGGGVLYKNPLHQNKQLVEHLLILLVSLREPM